MKKRGIATILGAAAAAAALVGFGAPGGSSGTHKGSGLGGRGASAASAAGVSAAQAGAPDAADPLAKQIGDERAWLHGHPDDASAWALLSAAYVERARVTADPTYLTKAQDALDQTSQQTSAQTDPQVLDGRAVLAAARHRFAAAGDLAKRAVAARAGDWMGWGLLSDTDVQLGRYDAARDELQRMMDLHPGVPAYTRAGHYFVLQGDLDRAEQALNLAASAATGAADIAFCYQQRGEAEWQMGRIAEASASYDAALRADPGYPMALAGRAHVEAGAGQTDRAVADYQSAIDRAPYPPLILEFGDFLTAVGRHDDAARQVTLFQAEQRLLAAAGVGTAEDGDLLMAGQYLADHGDPARAVAVLTGLWHDAPSVETADAYAWALHRAGRDREALPVADQAMRLAGYKPLYAFHRGEIEKALGEREAARRDLGAAVGRNAEFSPLWGPVAAADLRALR